MTAIARLESTPLISSEIRLGGAEGAVGVSAQHGVDGSAAASDIDSFGAIFSSAIDQANRADMAATQKVDALASGAADDLHGTMISVKEADISIRLVGTVRNKILDAFQELWRTSV
jgi:flagellar hook-basal body complex protein FliE